MLASGGHWEPSESLPVVMDREPQKRTLGLSNNESIASIAWLLQESTFHNIKCGFEALNH